jgi:hypothetical protein
LEAKKMAGSTTFLHYSLVMSYKDIIYPSLFFFTVVPTLELRASVKRFVSLQFLNPKTVGRTPWTGDQPVSRPPPTQTE